jgi:hypothetical protein
MSHSGGGATLALKSSGLRQNSASVEHRLRRIRRLTAIRDVTETRPRKLKYKLKSLIYAERPLRQSGGVAIGIT